MNDTNTQDAQVGTEEVVEVSSTIKALEKEKAANQKRQELLAGKYPHAILSTLFFIEAENKFACNIECTKCQDRSRVVRTSDLFQVSLCEGCQAAEKKARKAARRAAMKAAQVEVAGHVGEA